MANPFSNVDFSQYPNWERITSPNGQLTYYVIPNTGYVYNPTIKTVGPDPRPGYQAQQDAKKTQDDQIKAAKHAASPEGQLLPVVGTVGGLAGANYFFNKMNNASNAAAQNNAINAATGNAANTGIKIDPQVAANGAATTQVSPAQQAFSQTALSRPQLVGVNSTRPYPVGQTVDGGTLMSDGSAVAGDGTVTLANGTRANPQTGLATDSSGNSLGGVQAAQAIQGALGVLQLYNAYQSYKQGDTVGAATGTAAGAAAIGTAAGNSTAAAALPYAGAAAGAYGLYQNGQYVGNAPAGGQRNSMSTVQGASAGAAIGGTVGSVVPVVGTAIGAGIGALVGGAYGFANSYFGSSKDKYQMIRDKGRKYLQQNGILDGNYQGTLADGSTFDFGKDGKKAGKADFSNPLYGKAAAFGNVLASAEGFSGRSREAMATLYANAAVSNAKDPATVQANFAHFAQQRGLTQDAVQAQLDKMKGDNAIKGDEYNVFSHDATEFIPGPNGTPNVATAAPTNAMSPNVIAVPRLPARSATLSPGVGLNGQRIDYTRQGLNLAARMNSKNQEL